MLETLAGLFGLGAGLLAYYAWRIEPFKLVIRRRVFEVQGLDPSAGPLTILHLSDLHMRAGEHQKAQMLATLEKLDPDLTVITGDFVQSTADARFCGEVVRGLKAKHGVIGVLGNHDHFRYSPWSVFRRTRKTAPSRTPLANDSREIVRVLEGAGVTILINANLRLDVDGQEIWIIGVDDPYHQRQDLPRALRGVPSHAVKLLLAHSPDIIDEAAEAGIGLILCGHTHGGQVRLPLIGAPVTRTRNPLERPSGVVSRNGTLVHITPGIGGGTLTLRFRCPPEATLIELRPAPSSTSCRAGQSTV